MVNFVNFVGCRLIGFNINYEWEFFVLGVIKMVMINRRIIFIYIRYVNILYICFLSIRSIKLSLKE